MARPSILSSHTKAASAVSGAMRAMRSNQACSSSRPKASSRLIMGERCCTGENNAEGAPATRRVGESGVTRLGCASSRTRSSPDERVVVGVGDLGRVELVVTLVVMRDQARAAPRRGVPRHRCAPDASAMSGAYRRLVTPKPGRGIAARGGHRGVGDLRRRGCAHHARRGRRRRRAPPSVPAPPEPARSSNTTASPSQVQAAARPWALVWAAGPSPGAGTAPTQLAGPTVTRVATACSSAADDDAARATSTASA